MSEAMNAAERIALAFHVIIPLPVAELLNRYRDAVSSTAQWGYGDGDKKHDALRQAESDAKRALCEAIAASLALLDAITKERDELRERAESREMADIEASERREMQELEDG